VGLLAACSTAPKRPAEVFTVRNVAETQLDLAQKEADKGNYEKALTMLDEVRRLAVSVDSPAVRVREALLRGSAMYYLGNEADAIRLWENASVVAEQSGEVELAAMARIHLERGKLLNKSALPDAVLTAVNLELSVIKKNRLFIATGWVVIGLASKEAGLYEEAEAAFKKSLAIHGKDNYLEAAGEDWFLIASARSVAGDTEGAVNALWEAIMFDRRAENSYGLAMDWRAMGDVYKKAQKVDESRLAYNRSIAILRAIGLESDAEAVEKRF
jgi:tetratricopeptide (TPR) repeat protein